MVLKKKTSGWYGGNAQWDTYECTYCEEEVHSMRSEPTPVHCPYCGLSR